MKKLLLFLLLIILFSPQLVKADGETEISSWTELASIGNDVNYPCNGSYLLTKDLTDSDTDYAAVAGSEAGFQPICSAGDDFSGIFDGQSHEIQGLVINSIEGAGLFGDLEAATIKNLSLVNISVTGNGYYVGGLAKRTSGGTIENVHVSGTVTNNAELSDCTGGMIGSVEESTTISESSTNVNVASSRFVGGLVGCSNYEGENETGATISQSYSEGEVNATIGYVGGLVGSANTTIISNSYSTAIIIGSDRVGGLVGYINGGEVSQSYSDNGLISGDNYVGGLIGWAQSTTIRDTYSRSSVSSTSGQFIGGLVGLLGSEFMGSIYNSYATGNVEGLYTIGGLVGAISDDDIHDSFSTGDITLLDSGAWIGGVFGDYQNTWIIDNVFWYKSDHNSELTCYSGGDCSGNDTAISTEEGLLYFYDASNQPLNGWNFNTVWLEHENDYPTLRNIPEAIVDSDEEPASTLTPSNSSNNSSSPSNKTAPTCNEQKPNAPDLFQINTTLTNAKLYFTPLSNTNTYFVSFSTQPSAEEHGEEVTLSREGVQSHQIYFLRPNTTYYLKVRGQNGCATGEWSNIMQFKTDTKIYYKNFVPKRIFSSTNQPLSSSSNITVYTVPTSEPTFTPTPMPNIRQASSNANNQSTKKKCFLWWCW